MSYYFTRLLDASAVATALGVVVLLILLVVGSRIKPCWSYVLLMLVTLKLLWIFPPSSPSSWEVVLDNVRGEQEISITKEPEALSSYVSEGGTWHVSNDEEEAMGGLTNRIPEGQHTQETGAFIWLKNRQTPSLEFILTSALWVWAIGACVLFGIYATNLVRLRSLIGRSTKVTEGEIFELLLEACEVGGLKKPPSLVLSDELNSPALAGVIEPTIILPKLLWGKISNHDLKMIIIHELGHFKRKDLWVNKLMLLAQILHWFNPIAWFLFKKTRIEAEKACDSWVLAKIGEQHKEEYGNALINLLASISQSKRLIGAVSVLEGMKDLKARMRAISGHGQRQSVVTTCVLFSVLIVLTSSAFTKRPRNNSKFQIPHSEDGGINPANIDVVATGNSEMNIDPDDFLTKPDGIEESEYSDWCSIEDLQSSFNNRPDGTYWIYSEGRNNDGIDEFRWVQRPEPKDVNDWWINRTNMGKAEYVRIDRNLRVKGYYVLSSQVFINASGKDRYQVIWVKPFDEKITITASSLSEDKKDLRTPYFPIWEDSKSFQSLVSSRKITACPIYVEYNNKGEVQVLVSKEIPLNYRMSWGRSMHDFMHDHNKYNSRGYQLLSLSKMKKHDQSHRFSGVWIKSKNFENAKLELMKMGISIPSIKIVEK